LGYLKKEITH